MSARVITLATLRKQREASDPHSSAWVSAHAGSGKTHVLAQRVMRLLLAQAAPSHILCLTYTKAAAANMSARIFGALARWTSLDDAALARELEAIGAPSPSRSDLDFARRLFARAVETPGGLKIHTIHAFCERLLHLFPFEANAPAGFRVVDEMAQAELMARARRYVLDRAAARDSPLRDALARIAREVSATGFEQLCREFVTHRNVVAQIVDPDYTGRLRRRLGLAGDETLARVEALMIEEGEPPQFWPSLARLLQTGGKNDAKLAEKLLRAHALAPHPDCIDLYLSAFFNSKGEPRGVTEKGRFISAALAKREPMLLARMEAERDRLGPLIDKHKAAACAERSLALAILGDAILHDYTRAKRQRGFLDYDDLIEGARRLLHRSSPSWVLYKLDSQIEHILLDEAQDTSAAQWDILSAVADEFCAGAGVRRSTRGPARSFFAVGDEKQSIFSFQGAAPEKFDDMRRAFMRRFQGAERPFPWVRLVQSFRSAPGVLETVDDVFAYGDNGRGLYRDSLEPPPRHEACKQDVAALIEIWEPIGPQKPAESADWRLPLDYVSHEDPTEQLARKIARKIVALLASENGECVEDGGDLRPVQAGDILILVRRRGPLFEAINRALKAAGVAVAGADRLSLGDHIAVNDLVALGRALLLPDDDLTLATALKSPLFGLNDEDLLKIAPERSASLYAALAGAEDITSRAATARFDAWRRLATTLSPFDFFSQVLGPDGGRAAMVARLGPEANDAIDEFLRLALNFERAQAPALTIFLTMIEKLDLSIKRDMETGGGAVRVMTAHGAKGLEAKIVFLPDTCGAPAGQHDPKLYALGEEEDVLLWSIGKEHDAQAILDAREARRQAERDEYQRLLYVALTRAEERLYVAACHGAKGRAPGCWYDAIRSAVEPQCDVVADPLEPEATLLRRGVASIRLNFGAATPERAATDIPAFARRVAPYEKAVAPPLRPSSALAGADNIEFITDAPPTRADARRMLIGRLIHALLQYLPDCAPDARVDAARRFVAARGASLDETERAALTATALGVVGDARFAALFGADSAAEVDVIATLREGIVVSGRIDRLAVTEQEVVLAEFKSGFPRAALDPRHLRQLALYRAAVAPLYPGKQIRALVIFTQNAALVEPAAEALDAALAQAFAAAG